MKKVLPISILLLLVMAACKKPDIKTDVPTCIEKKINKLYNSKVQNPPAKVYKWEVDGQVYFLFSSPCCDQYSYLYDEDCNVVCAPSGGFSGSGDGTCPEWQGQKVETLVWEDDRE